TDGILVDLSNYWRKVLPENNGETVRVECSVIGSNINQALKQFGRKIGPDPASINAAMMGGILSNNSSGMCCGVVQNSYHTLKHMTLVLPNGLVFNSELLRSTKIPSVTDCPDRLVPPARKVRLWFSRRENSKTFCISSIDNG